MNIDSHIQATYRAPQLVCCLFIYHITECQVINLLWHHHREQGKTTMEEKEQSNSNNDEPERLNKSALNVSVYNIS